MSKANATARRVRVERNIYRRQDASGQTVHEVGYRDSAGRQRWRTVDGGITAARAARHDVLGRKGRGERVQPNPKLRFGEAADAWLAKQVAELRPATQAIYTNAIETHLRPRWGRQRLDSITVEDVAELVRELRRADKAEWTIAGVVKAANRTFKFAKRRMNWHGQNPVLELEKGERPKVSAAARRPIFVGDQLAQTLAAAREPCKTLFAVGSVTGARISECLGLVWADVQLDDLDAAAIRFEYQVDRRGHRQLLKTDESRRTIEIPRQLAAMLVAHKLRSDDTSPSAFVFATRSGAAIQQRNVGTALRWAQQQATDDHGRPTFPVLHERDEDGCRMAAPRGVVPSFHSFRHTAASEAIAAGESAEEVSWSLGHKNSVVTRAVYVQEVKNVERTARRRARMEERYGSLLEAADRNGAQQTPDRSTVEVLDLPNARTKRSRR
ncbi:MAG: tyrosine-type recombinase/integrase [Solirubrobacteraceae bacterium]